MAGIGLRWSRELQNTYIHTNIIEYRKRKYVKQNENIMHETCDCIDVLIQVVQQNEINTCKNAVCDHIV